jgi:DNA-binding GntR family transcriptional regulator
VSPYKKRSRSRSTSRSNGPAKKGRGADRPRYQQVADELKKNIGRGVYPVGGLLPTEMELCDRYRISRSTVREALRQLRDAGLISRRRRVGTAVLSRTPPASYRQPTNTISDLLQYAESSRVEILSKERVVADRALAELLECRIGQAWIRIDSLRRMPGNPSPISMTTAYLDARLPDIDRNLEALDGPISAMLERIYGMRIGRIEQSIDAISLGKRQAKQLRAEAGSPALRATRRYYRDGGALVELSIAVHPSDRFAYVTSLVRA